MSDLAHCSEYSADSKAASCKQINIQLFQEIFLFSLAKNVKIYRLLAV